MRRLSHAGSAYRDLATAGPDPDGHGSAHEQIVAPAVQQAANDLERLGVLPTEKKRA